MSGHSKWATTKRKKAVVDAKRGKMLTKMLREIQTAVKAGGPNLDGNARLKVAVQNAKMNSVPADKIDYAIKKASGATEADNYEEIMYEGYAPNGVACLIMTLTDNKKRTVAEVRHALTKFGGSLGSSNSVFQALEAKGKNPGGEIQKVPVTTVKLSGEQASKVIKCLDALEDLDDVQTVVSNFDTDDDIE